MNSGPEKEWGKPSCSRFEPATLAIFNRSDVSWPPVRNVNDNATLAVFGPAMVGVFDTLQSPRKT